MNKNTKTALIVALSLFGAGVLVCLCISFIIHFDYSKLSVNSNPIVKIGDKETIKDETYKKEHIEKNIDEKGQDIVLNLISADVTVESSSDGHIHLSYDNTDDIHFELAETDNSIKLTEKQKDDYSFDILSGNYDRITVVLSLPSKRDGKLNINGASSEISVSNIDISKEMGIFSVSGNVTIKDCKTESLDTGTTSGEIEVTSVDTGRIKANSVSGSIKISEISKGIPMSIASTSGEVYAENVKTEDLNIETTSGEVSLKDTIGQKADISTTSGSVDLSGADFREIKFKTISGEITGTVAGSSEDYTVYTDTLSGDNSLSGHRGRGERTLDLTSTSGSFDIQFEK